MQRRRRRCDVRALRRPGAHEAVRQMLGSGVLQRAVSVAALADAQFARGDAESAVSSLQRAAQLAPDDAAIANNLASVQLARGCVNAARQVLDRVDMAAAAPAIATALQGTLQELAAAGPDHCPH